MTTAGFHGTCRGCGAELLWARMPSGRLNPLNVETVEPEIGKGIIAFNPRNGSGWPVTMISIEAARALGGLRDETTFHISHFATCPKRAAFRDNDGPRPSAPSSDARADAGGDRPSGAETLPHAPLPTPRGEASALGAGAADPEAGS